MHEIAGHCIFSEPWWLDAVAPDAWDEVTVYEDIKLVARMPFHIDRSGPILRLGMPPFTQTLGPWILPGEGDDTTYLNREMALFLKLIESLPDEYHFNQNFHSSVKNWLPFYWQGFSQTTRYTYRILPDDGENEAWERMHSRARNQIRSAQSNLQLRDDLGVEELIRQWIMMFERQSKSVPVSTDTIRRIYDAAISNNAGQTLFAINDQGQCCAAAMFVWDDSTSYYLLSGADPTLRSSNGQSMLVWEGIRNAIASGRVFDFEGSMLQPVEHFFRGFGAIQTPYSQVWYEMPVEEYRPNLLMRLRRIFGDI